MSTTNIYGRPDARKTIGAMLAGTEHTSHKKIANNTVRYTRPNGDVVTRLHLTDVVVKHPDGTFTLNSGGYRTMTTRARIEANSPARIYSDKGIWHVRTGDDPDRPYRSLGAPFVDGMRVDASGLPIGVTPKSAVRELKRIRAEKAAIKRFCDRVDTLSSIPRPNNGDCWFCSMHTTDTGATLGDAVGDNEHIREHVRTGYLHGSLLYNALRESGRSDPQIAYLYHAAEQDRNPDYYRDIIKRALRKYLNRHFGLPA